MWPCLAGNEWCIPVAGAFGHTKDEEQGHTHIFNTNRWWSMKIKCWNFHTRQPSSNKILYQKWNVTDFSLFFIKTRKILEYLCTDSLIHRRMLRNHFAELTGAGKKDWGQEAQVMMWPQNHTAIEPSFIARMRWNVNVYLTNMYRERVLVVYWYMFAYILHIEYIICIYIHGCLQHPVLKTHGK